MTKLAWDTAGDRTFETGVDHGVLFLRNNDGDYDQGFAWNGLTTVTESPAGADTTPLYADNIKYLNLIAAETFGGTIEAYTYPEAFGQCDGTAEPHPGVKVGQQRRRTFGLAYRTLLGNDIEGQDYGYKLHLMYGALAAPSERAYATVNDSPAAVTFSWAVSTTPVGVTGLRPTSLLTVDSTTVDAAGLAALEAALYGTDGADPYLPEPNAVIAMLAGGALTTVSTVAPTYNSSTDTVTIPATVGVVYSVNGEPVTGSFVITEDTVVTARPAAGYVLDAASDTDFTVRHT